MEHGRIWNFAWRYETVSNQRRLGRGLEALLGRASALEIPTPTVGSTPTPSAPINPASSGASAARLILHTPEEVEEAASTIPVMDVSTANVDPNPWQPRSSVDDADLAELSESLKQHGLLQSIVVRRQGDRYQLIAGQRRLAAVRRLGWGTVQARVMDVDDRQMSEIAIVENLQRRDLDPLEKAASFRQYIKTWNVTQEELASRLSIDRSSIANLIRLLELPESVQAKLRSGAISMGHARAILPLGDENLQSSFAERIVTEGLSVRSVEGEVQEILRSDEATEGDSSDGEATGSTARRSGRPASKRSSQVAAVESQLRRALGTKVVVHTSSKGAGRIVIPFANHDEFQRLLEQITRS